MPRTRIGIDGPDPIDVHLGAKVRSRRQIIGFSQGNLADLIGLTFQQLQKYERGTNRISVSRLIDISKALKVPLEYFFEGCTPFSENGKKSTAKGFSDSKQAGFDGTPSLDRESVELLRAYHKIKTPKMKKQLLEMARALADDEK
jgi:transcriptional regulator with XRE-family HTH domain